MANSSQGLQGGLGILGMSRTILKQITNLDVIQEICKNVSR